MGELTPGRNDVILGRVRKMVVGRGTSERGSRGSGKREVGAFWADF